MRILVRDEDAVFDLGVVALEGLGPGRQGGQGTFGRAQTRQRDATAERDQVL